MMPGYTPPSPGGSDGPPSPYRFTLRRAQPEPAPGPSGVRFAPGHVSIPLPELPDEPPLPPIPPQSPGSAYSSSSEHSSPRGGVHLPGLSPINPLEFLSRPNLSQALSLPPFSTFQYFAPPPRQSRSMARTRGLRMVSSHTCLPLSHVFGRPYKTASRRLPTSLFTATSGPPFAASSATGAMETEGDGADLFGNAFSYVRQIGGLAKRENKSDDELRWEYIQEHPIARQPATTYGIPFGPEVSNMAGVSSPQPYSAPTTTTVSVFVFGANSTTTLAPSPLFGAAPQQQAEAQRPFIFGASAEPSGETQRPQPFLFGAREGSSSYGGGSSTQQAAPFVLAAENKAFGGSTFGAAPQQAAVGPYGLPALPAPPQGSDGFGTPMYFAVPQQVPPGMFQEQGGPAMQGFETQTVPGFGGEMYGPTFQQQETPCTFGMFQQAPQSASWGQETPTFAVTAFHQPEQFGAGFYGQQDVPTYPPIVLAGEPPYGTAAFAPQQLIVEPPQMYVPFSAEMFQQQQQQGYVPQPTWAAEEADREMVEETIETITVEEAAFRQQQQQQVEMAHQVQMFPSLQALGFVPPQPVVFEQQETAYVGFPQEVQQHELENTLQTLLSNLFPNPPPPLPPSVPSIPVPEPAQPPIVFAPPAQQDTGFCPPPPQPPVEFARANDDLKFALQLSDQFGQQRELASLTPRPKPTPPRETKPPRTDDIHRLHPRSKNPMKANLIPAALPRRSIFEGMAEEISECALPGFRNSRKLILGERCRDKGTQCRLGKAPQKRAARKVSPRIAPSTSSTQTQTARAARSAHPGIRISLTDEDLQVSLPADQSAVADPLNVTLTRPDYYTLPPLDELRRLKGEDGTSFVTGFTVGRVGYGNIYFPDTMDVSNLNLDEIVHIDRSELTVYPDHSKIPPVGEGLNRRAQVTMDDIYPVVNGVMVENPCDELVQLFEGQLKGVCERKSMRFLEYRSDTGSFVFEVEHFCSIKLDELGDSLDIKDWVN